MAATIAHAALEALLTLCLLGSATGLGYLVQEALRAAYSDIHPTP